MVATGYHFNTTSKCFNSLFTSVIGFTTALNTDRSVTSWTPSRSRNAPPHSSLFTCRKNSCLGCRTSLNVSRTACISLSTSGVAVPSVTAEAAGVEKETTRLFSPRQTKTFFSISARNFGAKRCTHLREGRQLRLQAVCHGAQKLISQPRATAHAQYVKPNSPPKGQV